MAEKPEQQPKKEGMSKTKLVLGAGALFLFIVGVKKTWPRPDASPPRPRETRDRGDDRDG
jgi:hypothetical protein